MCSSRSTSMAVHVRAMLDLQRMGAIIFDYGNNIRQQAYGQGVTDAFDFPGFVPAYIRPLFCEGKGPFRWAALSGDPADISKIDDMVLREFADNAIGGALDKAGAGEGAVPGPAGAHLLAGLRRAGALRAGGQRDGAQRAN